MGKKKAKSAGPGAADSRLSHRLKELLAHGQRHLEGFFESATVAELREIVEESCSSDLVNVLLDLRRASVKAFFERVVGGRKRLVAPSIALYHYKVYLRDTVPLEVNATNGERLPNYYAILGVPRDATADEIEDAHKHLQRAFSSDLHAESDHGVNSERLAEIKDAFGNLKTETRREVTDRLLPNINYLYPRRDDYWLESVRQLLS